MDDFSWQIIHNSPNLKIIKLFYFSYIITVYLRAVNAYPIDLTVNFEQPNYTINETDRIVRLVMVLSNPSSTNISVQVSSTDGSATGKQLTISCTIIE